MARTKGGSKSKPEFQIRTIKTKKDRATGLSIFHRLKTQERMVAYALFKPDPEADDNPGYKEYLEHYDKANNSFVPCVGENCYMCAQDDTPNGRALTLWYFPDNDAKERLKLFKLNGWLIRDFEEIEEEFGGVYGKKFRIKRTSDKGEYRISDPIDKPLKEKELAKLVGSDDVPDIDDLLIRQYKSAAEKAKATAAMTDADDDDDDEDDEDEQPKARRGRAKVEEPETDDDEDEEDEDEEDEESDDEDESDEEDEEESDEDEDENGDDEDEDADEEEDEDEQKTLAKAKFEVVKTDKTEETVTVKIDGKNTKLWVGEGMSVDYAALKKGVTITVDAVTDEEGDWILTKLNVAKAKDEKSSGKKATSGKKR